MAVDRFQEGMSGYLSEVERMNREESAQALNDLADSIRSGSLNLETISSLAIQVTRETRDTAAVIQRVRGSVSYFVENIKNKLNLVGVELPPAEILLGAPYELSRQSEPSFRVRSALVGKALIKANLGDPANFLIPVDFDSQSEHPEPEIERLGLSTGTRNILRRNEITTIEGILKLSPHQFEGVQKLGSKRQDEVLGALFNYGVLPGRPVLDTGSPDSSMTSPLD